MSPGRPARSVWIFIFILSIQLAQSRDFRCISDSNCPGPGDDADEGFCCSDGECCDYDDWQDDKDDDDDLSTGAIVGIVFGVIAGILVFVIIAYCCYANRHRLRSTTGPQTTRAAQPGAATVPTTLPAAPKQTYPAATYPGPPPYEAQPAYSPAKGSYEMANVSDGSKEGSPESSPPPPGFRPQISKMV